MMSLFTVIWSHLSKVARFCYDMTLGFLLTVARFCYDMTLGFLLTVARFCYDMTLGFLLKMSLFTVIWSFLSKVARFCYDMTLGFLLEIMNIPEKINSAVQRLVPGRTIRKRVVGLFSREAEDSYHFLREALRFHDVLVREVRTFTITNNGGSRFRDEVSQCDFAILYHSKKRGRLNITDVTDSIYDEELKHLSKTLGKENVLVVADDLDSTTQGDKAKILNSQPLIQERARDLILFRSDKNTYNKETQEKINKILSHIG
ncbi:uncharacterized protein LOC120942940 isoform X6 [Rana temporaria]|uniref:uncharacterized protein LOC120942940 isoform X6 n=1 Tax=Rana temporaria TaxID=8407 RepID=UPI001AAD6218|nr:uncharacterized protein LOC120942940 isoform X6 [Rana temporaria]